MPQKEPTIQQAAADLQQVLTQNAVLCDTIKKNQQEIANIAQFILSKAIQNQVPPAPLNRAARRAAEKAQKKAEEDAKKKEKKPSQA